MHVLFLGEMFAPSLTVSLELKSTLCYGENPDQNATFYVDKYLFYIVCTRMLTTCLEGGTCLPAPNLVPCSIGDVLGRGDSKKHSRSQKKLKLKAIAWEALKLEILFQLLEAMLQ